MLTLQSVPWRMFSFFPSFLFLSFHLNIWINASKWCSFRVFPKQFQKVFQDFKKWPTTKQLDHSIKQTSIEIRWSCHVICSWGPAKLLFCKFYIYDMIWLYHNSGTCSNWQTHFGNVLQIVFTSLFPIAFTIYFLFISNVWAKFY